MSHNHYLGCRACMATTEEASENLGTGNPYSCYGKFVDWYGDSLVTNALATRALVKDGIELTHGTVWARFVSEHAGCGTFYELCAQGCDPWGEVSCGCPRQIPVKGVPAVSCKTCHDRRLVPCPDCKEKK